MVEQSSVIGAGATASVTRVGASVRTMVGSAGEINADDECGVLAPFGTSSRSCSPTRRWGGLNGRSGACAGRRVNAGGVGDVS